MALTVKQIENAKPKAKQYKLSDGHGLCLNVAPSGGKHWRWRYRFQGVPNEMSLGEYPVVSLQQAREIHATQRKILQSGTNPMATRKVETEEKRKEILVEQAKTANSFAHVAKLWWDVWSIGKESSNAQYIWSMLTTYTFPVFGHKHVSKVSPADLRTVMAATSSQGLQDVPRRIHICVNQIYRYAIAHEIADSNPAAHFRPGDILPAKEVEHFKRVAEEDLGKLLLAIDGFVGYRGEPITRLAIKLMTLTFVRTHELRVAPWTEFNFDRAIWVIPQTRMKKVSKRAVKRESPHIVPLSRQTLELLRVLKETGRGGQPSQWVLPGFYGPERPIGENFITRALKKMGYSDEMTGHGFRGVASTILHETGEFLHDDIEMQLSHVQKDKVAAAYNDAKRITARSNMMQWWADYVDRRLSEERLASVKGLAC